MNRTLRDKLIVAPVVLISSLMIVLSGGCDGVPTGGDPTSPEAQGQTIADQIEEDAEIENTEVRHIRRFLGPEGSLYGMVFEDSLNSLYMLGDKLPDGSVNITGAVLEDIRDNLILMEEITPDGNIKITIPTGDSTEFEVLPGGGLRVTMTLQGSLPPSTLVFEIDSNEETTIDEAASTINLVENSGYNDGAIEVPRAPKMIQLPRGSKPIEWLTMQRFDCPSVSSIINAVDVTCLYWTIITSKAPTLALDSACISANGFLGGFRGSDSAPGGPVGPETAPVAIAFLKLGVNAGCSLFKAGWSVGKLLKKALPPDLLCMGVTIVEEGTRIITSGENISDAVCEAIGGPPANPEGDPFFAEGCDNTCQYAADGFCDDGGPNSRFSFCELGTDCTDCGARDIEALENPEGPDCFDDGVCNAECPIDPPDPDCFDIDFCENFQICCNGDGICDLVRCPEQSDSDCTNLHFCDRLGVCCEDDLCDSTRFDCPEADADCSACNGGNICIGFCEPIDPDCVANNDCPVDDVCENCVGNDPDCDRCGAGDGCVTGCSTDDPDCATVPGVCGPADTCCGGDNLCETFCDPGITDPDCDLCTKLGERLDGVCIQNCSPGDGDCLNKRQCEDLGECCANDGFCDLDFFLCDGGQDVDCPQTNAEICTEYGLCCPAEFCNPLGCPEGDPGCP